MVGLLDLPHTALGVKMRLKGGGGVAGLGFDSVYDDEDFSNIFSSGAAGTRRAKPTKNSRIGPNCPEDEDNFRLIADDAGSLTPDRSVR